MNIDEKTVLHQELVGVDVEVVHVELVHVEAVSVEALDVALPDEVRFAHPEDAPSPQEEAALRDFLQAFESGVESVPPTVAADLSAPVPTLYVVDDLEP